MVSKRGVLKVFSFYSRPNAQCAIGAMVGLAAIVLPWIREVNSRITVIPPASQRFYWMEVYWNGLDLVISHVLSHYSLYLLLFVLGTIAALFTPLGGIAQVAGLLGFALTFRFFNSGLLSYSPVNEHLSIGYFAAILSTVLVITSSMSAIRNSNGGRPTRALSRFAAVCPSALR